MLCAFIITPCVIHTQVNAKNEIDAPKENQCTCTTDWLLNGFLSQEMFKVHKKYKKNEIMIIITPAYLKGFSK